MKKAAQAFHHRFRASGEVLAVRTFDLITFPYPLRYGLLNACRLPFPYLMMTNRCVLVQFEADGDVKNLLMNPTDHALAQRTPYFADLIQRYGEWLSDHVLSTVHGTVREHLARVGIEPTEIDYVTFDHLHTQDIRFWIGTTAPIAGMSDEPVEPYFPNATFIFQRAEVEIFQNLHPLQRMWYVADGLRDIRTDRLLLIEGDIQLGEGVALLATPGHTAGNHSLAMNTSQGIYVISENGVAADGYSPEASEIPGLRAFAQQTGQEVVMNGNTLEGSLAQYTSMLKEKYVAGHNAENPAFYNVFPSSELTASWIAPGLRPTFAHRGVNLGELRRKRVVEPARKVSLAVLGTAARRLQRALELRTAMDR